MNFLRAIKLIFTLRCEQSSRLVSDSLDRKLSLAERAAVRLHRIGCWSCRRLAKQMQFIRQCAESAGKPAIFGDEKLPAATRLRILQAIQEQRDGS